MKNGALKAVNGVLIAEEVDDGGYAPGRNEDGLLIMTYDSDPQRDLVRVSNDRGVTWA